MTKHFTLTDVTRSQKASRLGIDNSLPDDMKPYWQLGCESLEKVRTLVNAGQSEDIKLTISSGFRCTELNKNVSGSSATSQHTGKWKGLYCCAFDIECEIGNGLLFSLIADSSLEFDQLIWEYGTDEAPAWVHIGFVFGRPMRNQLLRKRKGQNYEVFA